MYNNDIGNEGVSAISEALKVNKSLTTIGNNHKSDLSNNNIGDDGAVAISEALKANRSLITICIHH